MEPPTGLSGSELPVDGRDEVWVAEDGQRLHRLVVIVILEIENKQSRSAAQPRCTKVRLNGHTD